MIKAYETRRVQVMQRGALLPASYTKAEGPPLGFDKGFAPMWTRRRFKNLAKLHPSLHRGLTSCRLPSIPEETASDLEKNASELNPAAPPFSPPLLLMPEEIGWPEEMVRPVEPEAKPGSSGQTVTHRSNRWSRVGKLGTRALTATRFVCV